MIAPVDATSTQWKPKSRRALLAGALGGLGAWAAGALGRVSPVQATDGQPLVVGQAMTATGSTSLLNLTNNNYVFAASSEAGGIGLIGGSNSGWGVRGRSTSGVGVRAESESGFGVFGLSGSGVGILGRSDGDIGISGISSVATGVSGSSGPGYGVHGFSNASVGVVGRSNATSLAGTLGQSAADSTGVQGYSGSDSVPAAKPKTGVYGYATQDADSRGVWGQSNAGQGVRGQTQGGIGLFGLATSGFALRTSGRVRVDKVSGVATIPAGAKRVTVTAHVNVTADAFVLLTPQANIGSRGLWFATDTAANTFTIRMSSARSSGTKVAWLLLG